MAQLKDKTYRLVDDSFGVSFSITVGRNSKLIIYDDSDPDKTKHRNRAIRHCPNESSIFIDEQSSHAEVEQIIFVNKLFEVKGTDALTQKFLDVHPGNTANGGSYFEEVDGNKEAENEIAFEELVLDLKSLVREKEKEKDGIYELEALAAVLEGSIQTVKGMQAAELKRTIYGHIEADPFRFTDASGQATLFDDASHSRTYLALRAISDGIVVVSPDRKTITWKHNKSAITAVPRGLKPVEHLAEFLETDEGILVLQEIEKRL